MENRLVGISLGKFMNALGGGSLGCPQGNRGSNSSQRIGSFQADYRNELSNLIYNGLWFNPATDSDCLSQVHQQVVNGTAKVKLYKGSATVVARKSDNSLYDESLATYTMQILLTRMLRLALSAVGLPSKVHAEVQAHKDK